MNNYNTLTKQAKFCLKGNWGEAALGTLLFILYQGLAVGICSWVGIPFVDAYDDIESFYICLGIGFFIASCLFLGPLIAGYIKFIKELIYGECRFITLLSGFRDGYIVNCLIYVLACLSIGGVMFLAAFVTIIVGANGNVIDILIFLCAIVTSAYIFLRYYSLCYFISSDQKFKDKNVLSIIEINGELMNGKSIHAVGLAFSFWGWILLTFFTGGIGILLLWPYEIVTAHLFYDSIELSYKNVTQRIKTEFRQYSAFQIFTWSFITFGLVFFIWLILFW